ncbi:hypothetical protein I306_01223 [Cryptococcus gattii EJB2]|uniref:CCHC-type domain-containing protein n=1 Tax=Cryptococcus gattii EJB2 TaxID=1296103 RepID=A0ABR5C1Y0_9TREE|nr:hypothetical protein I306_01223 [Cryptococcus gattii EJB2]
MSKNPTNKTNLKNLTDLTSPTDNISPGPINSGDFSNWREPESEKDEEEITKYDHASGLGTSLSALPGRSSEMTTAPIMGKRLSRRETFTVDNGPAAEHAYDSVRQDASKGGRDAKVWNGTPATLKDHLRWFEHKAADCAVHPSDMVRIYLEYVDSRKVETLEGYENDSRENFKRQIEGNYRGRLDQRLADVDGFRAFSAKWSTRKLVLFEDLIEMKEELQVLTKRISRRMGDIAAKSLANEFFFKSLIPKQREELQLELISNKVVYPESDYPPMKEMLDILHGCVSIDNVVATNVRESLNPDVETNAQLIEREVIARQAYLERQRQPQARSMYLFGPEIFTKASMTEAKTPGVGVKTLTSPAADDTNIDDLVQKIESLEIAAAQGLAVQDYNHAEAKYRGYRARLMAANEKVAGMYPVSLAQLVPQVACVSQLRLDADMREDDIFYEINKLNGEIVSEANNAFQGMSELMRAHRGRYRQLPQWKHLYARAIAKVPELGQLNLLKPMTVSDTYRRPSPSSAFSSGCPFCGKPGHMARRCRTAEDLVNSKQPLIKMGERWYAAINPNDLTERVGLKRRH